MDRKLVFRRNRAGFVQPPTRGDYLASPLPIERELRALFPDMAASVIFDIGSCEGEDAIKYASLFRLARVFAVEPLPSNVRLLEQNIASHPGLNITIIPVALADAVGRSLFFVSSGHPPSTPAGDWDYGNKSSSLLAPDRHLDVHPWVRFDQQIEVEVATLESVCLREGISHIDFIHLDVQGAELAVLRGAGPLLDHVGAVWMEVEAIPLYSGQPLRADVERFMSERGFSRLVDTVDAVSGDQLYYNPRIVWPREQPSVRR